MASKLPTQRNLWESTKCPLLRVLKSQAFCCKHLNMSSCRHSGSLWCPETVQHDEGHLHLLHTTPSGSFTKPNPKKKKKKKHPNEPHMKVGRRGRRDELKCKENWEKWGKGVLRWTLPQAEWTLLKGSRKESRKVSRSLSLTRAHAHTGVGQIPISSPHMLSSECKCGAYEASWSKSYWVWDWL